MFYRVQSDTTDRHRPTKLRHPKSQNDPYSNSKLYDDTSHYSNPHFYNDTLTSTSQPNRTHIYQSSLRLPLLITQTKISSNFIPEQFSGPPRGNFSQNANCHIESSLIARWRSSGFGCESCWPDCAGECGWHSSWWRRSSLTPSAVGLADFRRAFQPGELGKCFALRCARR